MRVEQKESQTMKYNKSDTNRCFKKNNSVNTYHNSELENETKTDSIYGNSNVECRIIKLYFGAGGYSAILTDLFVDKPSDYMTLYVLICSTLFSLIVFLVQ